jgi:hypothetical protein
MDLRPLQEGWHNLGTFRLAGVASGAIVPQKLLALNADGRPVEVSFSDSAEK